MRFLHSLVSFTSLEFRIAWFSNQLNLIDKQLLINTRPRDPMNLVLATWNLNNNKKKITNQTNNKAIKINNYNSTVFGRLHNFLKFLCKISPSLINYYVCWLVCRKFTIKNNETKQNKTKQKTATTSGEHQPNHFCKRYFNFKT